ncbi:LOG family protein [Marinomonas colpomeniae]|uniref:Cytokinin riboside 5'-monophosphate phosphoribohydrolase n=1 Tax=Marinomonas colpomeniae TaxID=2774408 RepID=A0ABR8P0F7_9GAMM|nr:TIGR00730 family Rossman fold protein [Marinomonas colpomeniae]MBD5771355.1 TIGR00730 family Rossman fold protein [Marinomonas colpomeniae]
MKIAVFCGSSTGNNPSYINEAKKLGLFFGKNGIDLVYGGGKVGLMGTIADAVLESGGNVFGVIPEYLKEKEIEHTGLTELFVVADMHERKAKMASMADAFVALPGGAGTLEEFFEVWTWAQLGHHSKPCALYNTNGFYQDLLAMITNMTNSGFLNEEYANMLILADTPKELVDCIEAYQPPLKKWS